MQLNNLKHVNNPAALSIRELSALSCLPAQSQEPRKAAMCIRGSETPCWVLAVPGLTVNSGERVGSAFAPDAGESGQRDFSSRARFLTHHPQHCNEHPEASFVSRGANI